MKKNLFYTLLPLLLAGLESLFINFNNFKVVDKPPFSPPSIIFPIVWTILYLILGLTYNMIRKTDNFYGKLLFWIQLILNLSWSIIFFTIKQYLISLIILLLLIISVILMILFYTKTCRKSAYLNIPYIVWLLIAYYLSAGVYILNM